MARRPLRLPNGCWLCRNSALAGNKASPGPEERTGLFFVRPDKPRSTRYPDSAQSTVCRPGNASRWQAASWDASCRSCLPAWRDTARIQWCVGITGRSRELKPEILVVRPIGLYFLARILLGAPDQHHRVLLVGETKDAQHARRHNHIHTALAQDKWSSHSNRPSFGTQFVSTSVTERVPARFLIVTNCLSQTESTSERLARHANSICN